MNATAQLESIQPFRPLSADPRGDEPSQRGRLSGHLEAVSTEVSRRAKPRLFYAAVTVATVVVIVIAQLLLSIGVSQGAYQLGNLRSTNTSLQRDLQAATEAVNTLSSPQNLASNANALGMVTNGTPVYLRLSDGAVLGSPEPASAAAGGVTGAAGNLVPNALLAGIPLAGQHTASAAGATSGSAAKTAATPAANPTQAPDGPVALNGALPAPTTH